MSGDIDSAFVEIAAGAPDVDLAAELLLPLYEDPAEQPALELSGSVGWRVFVAVVLALIIAGGFLWLLFAVWLGQHGMLPAPN